MKLGKKDKTREIPRNSRQNFRNSREFPPGIWGSAIPGNSRTGIPGGLGLGARVQTRGTCGERGDNSGLSGHLSDGSSAHPHSAPVRDVVRPST